MTKVNQYRFNKTGNIQHKVESGIVDGQQEFTWTNLYTSVRCREISPLRTTEKIESNQPTSTLKKGWLVRLLDRSINANMRLVQNSVNHYIIGVRDYKEDRLTLVLDTETRDDE